MMQHDASVSGQHANPSAASLQAELEQLQQPFLEQAAVAAQAGERAALVTPSGLQAGIATMLHQLKERLMVFGASSREDALASSLVLHCGNIRT